MDKNFIKQATEKLNKQKDEIIQRLDFVKRNGTIEDTKGDEMDEIQVNFMNSMQTQISSRDLLKLRHVNEALEKIRKGNFGECEECGEEINTKRLQFAPELTVCLNCAENLEREQKHKF